MVYEDEEKKQYMVIKIKKPHHAERLAWIILAALLLSVILFQWLNWPDEDYCPDKEDTSSVTGKQAAAPGEELKEEAEELPAPETATAEKTEEKQEEKKLSGGVEFTIDNVAVAKTKSELGKITSVTYSIDNQKEDFVPLVRLYVLDSQWKNDSYTPELLRRCCENKPLFDLPLKAGAPVLKHTFTPNFPTLTALEEAKTIKMEVYDKADTATLLASGEYLLTKSSWG